jgi:hypothetical protein
MKTFALTLFAAALGLAQNSTPPATTPATTPAATTPAATPARPATTPQRRTAPPVPRVMPTAATAAQSRKPAQPSKPAPDQKAKAPSPAPSVPPGATLVEPNLYRFTDSTGKTWNYRQTPFGITKWEETSAPAAHLAAQPNQVKSEPVTVTDLGDSYRFQKKTPFGESNWVRKKSELTDDEKALVEGQPAQSSAPSTNVAGKPAGNL